MYGNVRGSLVFALLLQILVTLPSISRADESACSSADELTMLHLAMLYDSFVYDSTTDDTWWIESAPSDCTPSDLQRVSLTLAKQEVVLAGILKNYRPAGALGDSIFNFLNRPKATLYYQGASITFSARDTLDSSVTLGSQFEFCFIPESNIELGSDIQYLPDWDALLLPAVNWPEPVLAGLLFHEGGHAFLSGHSFLSYEEQDQYLVPQEAEMLNNATQGTAYELVDAIMARSSDKIPEVEMITSEDVHAFAGLLKAENTGPIVANAVFNQFIRLISVRVTSLAQNTPPSKTSAD